MQLSAALGVVVDPDADRLVVAVDGEQLPLAVAGELVEGGVEVELVALAGEQGGDHREGDPGLDLLPLAVAVDRRATPGSRRAWRSCTSESGSLTVMKLASGPRSISRQARRSSETS